MKNRHARVAWIAAIAASALALSPLVTTANAAVSSQSAAAPKKDNQSDKDTLQVGAARVDITPTDPKYPALNEYDHEKLNLRAIVFENHGHRGALIGADTVHIDAPIFTETIKAVAAELKTSPSNIIVSSTHAHSAVVPGPAVSGPAWGNAPGYLANAALKAVKEAESDMEPALMGYSTGSADLNVNRDAIDPTTGKWTQAANPDGPTDKAVAVLSFAHPDGSPIAAYVTYAMHPVNGYLGYYTSGDFPAAMSRWVEQSFNDKMVTVFAQNASGDVNPLWLRTGTNVLASESGVPITGYEMTREKVEQPVRDNVVTPVKPSDKSVHQLFDYIQSLGIVLGEEVIRIMSHTKANEGNPTIWGASDTVTCPGRTRLDNAREGVPGVYTDGPDVDIPTGMLGIGDVALANVGAEIYTRIGERIKAQSPMKNTMVVTLAEGKAASGYIPDEQSWDHQTFQVLGSKLKPGCAEDGIADSTTHMIQTYAHSR
ncbi:hypothetical protein [Streptomyces brasiliensis]|uniref:Neutral/alkaline non-lysosomal ceramidase N-terminal domain-containing protein n=1 Tax=Streptomyces brasiliensis TaxID=1954 RepID=A0A917LB12_9ACTN|nr:hypothetical protein [Streptomyces brasiliensis]GGJ53141.1 hypothetical protein GCM10010121_074940 [Streptomyces brasiliensis]